LSALYSDIGGHKKSRIINFGKLLRKTNEQEFSFRLRERRLADIQAETLSMDSLEMSDSSSIYAMVGGFEENEFGAKLSRDDV